MKFTVRIDGADTGLLERLIAAANRKLAGRRVHTAAPHSVINSPGAAAVSDTPPPPTPEANS